MHVWPNGIELLALLLEAAGVLLLFREVWRGREAEVACVTYAQRGTYRANDATREAACWRKRADSIPATYGPAHSGSECLRGRPAFRSESRKAIENECQDELGIDSGLHN